MGGVPGHKTAPALVRFYLDEHLSTTIAEIARGIGLDAVSCDELRRNGLTDEEQLRLATLDGRCIVTRDDDDFRTLTLLFFRAGRPHAGVLIVPPSMPTNQFSRIAHALRAYVQRHGAGSTEYLFDYLR